MPSDDSLAVPCAGGYFGLFLVFAFASAELLPSTIDACQFGLYGVVRFAELLDLLFQDRYPLGTVERGIQIDEEIVLTGSTGFSATG